MISWLVIAVLVICGVIAIRMNHLRHRVMIIVFLLLVLFLYVSATLVYNEHELNFNTAEGVFNGVKVYLGWLGNGFQNLKSLVGNAVKMDWNKINESFFNKTEKIEAKRL